MKGLKVVGSADGTIGDVRGGDVGRGERQVKVGRGQGARLVVGFF